MELVDTLPCIFSQISNTRYPYIVQIAMRAYRECNYPDLVGLLGSVSSSRYVRDCDSVAFLLPLNLLSHLAIRFGSGTIWRAGASSGHSTKTIMVEDWIRTTIVTREAQPVCIGYRSNSTTLSGRLVGRGKIQLAKKCLRAWIET
jgi:hypothetical protein